MDRTTQQQAAQMLADLANDGGGTYERSTFIPFRPKDGYAVGVGGAKFPASGFTIEVAGWLGKACAEEYDELFFGTWLDGETVHIDAVRYFAAGSFDEAHLLALKLQQAAFYSFADKVSFDTITGQALS